jgi:hypothetical protein
MGSQFRCFAKNIDEVLMWFFARLSISVHFCHFYAYLPVLPGIQTRLENKHLTHGIWFASCTRLVRL